MTADEFVASLARTAARFQPGQTICPDIKDQKAAVRAWTKARKRKKPASDYPPDPVLDLLARYDLSAVIIWQFRFVPALTPFDPGVWKVAERPTYEYWFSAILGGVNLLSAQSGPRRGAGSC